MLLYCFFFSSRRRHTRSLCDWSSDVCSSDLVVKSRWMADCILLLILTQFTYSGSLIFWQFLVWRHHFISNHGEEGPFYWLFDRGGSILFILFHYMDHALPGGLVVQTLDLVRFIGVALRAFSKLQTAPAPTKNAVR